MAFPQVFLVGPCAYRMSGFDSLKCCFSTACTSARHSRSYVDLALGETLLGEYGGAQGLTRHGFRQRTLGSHVIASQIYGIIYGTDESVKDL